MAALVRNSLLLQLRKPISRVSGNVRLISTSKKNSDTATVTPSATADPDHNFAKPDLTKNWISYGFDYESKEEDSNYHHATFFFSVTLCFIVGGVGWAYLPDINLRQWGAREAYLELRRREAQGLPLVDKNYLDPALMVLPSEEELGDTKLII